MAGDFTMAGLAMMRLERCNNLSKIDGNSPRANLRHPRPVTGGVARVASSDTDTQKALQRVLASPHRLKLLALKGFYIDDNQVIRKDLNFDSVAIALKHEARSRNAATNSSRIEPPCTPSSTIAAGVAPACDNFSSLTDTGIAFAREPPVNFSQHYYTAAWINMVPSPSNMASPNIAPVHLDKELPPKPVLSIADSPEKRGVFDAYDSSPEQIKYPALQPTSPNNTSTSSPEGNGSDFELSPSLRDMDYNPELMVARAVKIQHLGEMADIFTKVKKCDIAEVAEVAAPPKIAHQMKSTRHLPTTGQIAAMRAGSTGSPVYRGHPKSKFNGGRRDLYTSSFESLSFIPEGKSSLKHEVKLADDVFHTDSATGSTFNSPQGFDDATRRYTKYGVGATYRCVEGAHELIMGDRYPRVGSAATDKSAGISKGSTISGSATLQSSLAETLVQNGPYPPRVSSLPASDEDIASRLARPTKASAARAEANTKAPMGKSATMTSVKKLGSRISNILPGRGRSGTLVSNGKAKSMGVVDEKQEGVSGVGSAEGAGNDIKYQTAYYGRARIVEIKKNRMNAKSSSGFGSNIKDERLIGEPSDKLAPQESHRDKKERRATAACASGNYIHNNTGRARGAVNQQRGRDQDDDGPPTPRGTGAGPLGHYVEGAQLNEAHRQELQTLLATMRTTIAGTTGLEGVESSINLLRANGRNMITTLTSSIEQINDPFLRGRFTEIVRVVGEGIYFANANLAATLALADSHQRALTMLVGVAEFANVVVDGITVQQ